jgi:FkbM family methyltransferase
VVVDVGGYIGDFSVYAAKYLKAPKVIVYEPTAENFAILQQNIAANGYEQTIIAVNKGVSDRNESVLNVEKSESEEMHASVYWYEHGEKRTIPCDTMQQIFDTHKLSRVDLLKVDCEGGEYDIFPSMSDDLYSRIANIVFEYHTINGSDAKLTAILARLRSLGFDVTVKDEIVTARAVTMQGSSR